MKRLCTGSLALGLAVVLAAGCSRESPKGGPGTGKSSTTTTSGTGGTSTTTTTTDGDDYFKIGVPTGHTNVDQGGQTAVKVDVNRHGKFNEEVTLKFEPTAGSGLKVEPATVKVPADKKYAEVTVMAEAGAKVGTTNVKVIATPMTGKATEQELGMEVKKK